MSSTPADEAEPGGREALLVALEVPRNARIALVVGFVVAVLVTLFFLGLIAGGRPGEPVVYYLGLAFVVFVSTTLLAASVLTGRRAIALTVHPASLVRKGATLGLLGGLAWLGGGLALAVVGLAPGAGGPTGTGAAASATTVAGFLLPWAPLLSLGGVWAVHTRYKRVVPVRGVAAGGGLLAVPGALVVADLAALELSVLLAQPAPPDTDVPGLFVAGLAVLVLGHFVQGVSAFLAEGHPEAALLAVGPVGGLGAVVALGTGPGALAVLGTVVGGTWLVTCWRLRGVADADVPVPADRFEDEA